MLRARRNAVHESPLQFCDGIRHNIRYVHTSSIGSRNTSPTFVFNFSSAASASQSKLVFFISFWVGARVRLNLEQDQTHVEIFAEMVARKLHFEWPLSTCRNWERQRAPFVPKLRVMTGNQHSEGRNDYSLVPFPFRRASFSESRFRIFVIF